jgi:hypothetical protein
MSRPQKEFMARVLEIGPVAAMFEDEMFEGFLPVARDVFPWFTSEDWDDSVVTMKGTTVRLIAVASRREGALSRMITGLAQAGLTPVVVEPFSHMQAILRRWGWTEEIVGEGINRQQCWRPSPEWLADRAKESA